MRRNITRINNMDYEKIKDIRNNESFGKRLGIVYTNVAAGECDAELNMRDELLNLHNTVHGGILLTLADVTGGTAACTHGSTVVTVDSLLASCVRRVRTACGLPLARVRFPSGTLFFGAISTKKTKYRL